MRLVAFLACLSSALAQTAGPRPVIAVAGISHESDSFNPARTTLADFGWGRGFDPAQYLAAAAGGNTTVSGYVEGARLYGLELVPTIAVGAAPKGPVAAEAFETITAEMIRRIKAMPKLDGVLMPLHGAMVVESHPHGDEELVRRVRAAVGASPPIVVTHDFHANVSPETVKLCNALITFKENPHIDTRERGLQAARILAETLEGKRRPTQAIAKPPMMYNIVYQYTRREPLLPIVEESRRLERENPKILAVSVSGGYQYADVPYMGPSVIVVTDNDLRLAEREANRLAAMLWATRDRLELKLPDAAAAVRQAIAETRFPVALIDMGDNIGGGSSGDATFLLEQLLRQKAQGWVVTLADPAAVREAVKLGIGGAFDLEVGGKTDSFHGKPVRLRGRVKSLHDGQYVETEIRHGGGRYHNMGLSAVIEVEGSSRDLANLVLLTTRRSSPNSIHQIVSCGIYPERQRILTVKGAIAPRAAYEPVAAKIIEVDTPGLTAVNPARFEYRRVRRPLVGLDPDNGVLETRYLERDPELAADPEAPAWRGVAGVVTSNGRFGEPIPGARTEIRSRWTDENLYFLFVSRFESMYLISGPPKTDVDTWGLWDYDVVEVFIGWDLSEIRRYKEFEVSPRGEWIDLDVDRTKPKGIDAAWNSGMRVKTRVDETAKTWYCEMQIPWRSIDTRRPAAGNQLRLNLYRIEGGPAERKYLAWRPIFSPSYHTPEGFGLLRLAGRGTE